MTNQQIILNESIRLMKEGKLKGSGVFGEIGTEQGTQKIELTEEIHTFNGWKERGFKVKKGEHSKIKFPIWKFTSREKKEEEKNGSLSDDLPITNMFLKTSAFFMIEQVEKA